MTAELSPECGFKNWISCVFLTVKAPEEASDFIFKWAKNLMFTGSMNKAIKNHIQEVVSNDI